MKLIECNDAEQAIALVCRACRVSSLGPGRVENAGLIIEVTSDVRRIVIRAEDGYYPVPILEILVDGSRLRWATRNVTRARWYRVATLVLGAPATVAGIALKEPFLALVAGVLTLAGVLLPMGDRGRVAQVARALVQGA